MPTPLVKHRFVSPKPNSADATLASSDAWNDSHKLFGGAIGDLVCQGASDEYDFVDTTAGILTCAGAGQKPFFDPAGGGYTVVATTAVGTQADFALGTLSPLVWLRCNNATELGLTGIAGGVAGRVVVVENVGASMVSLRHEDVTSTAANRFIGGTRVWPGDRKIVVYDGTSSRWRPQLLGTFYRSADLQTISNSSAETHLLGASGVTMYGGTLGTNRQLVGRLVGRFLNNTGGGANLTLRFKYGATTWTLSFSGVGTVNPAGSLKADFTLAGAESTGAQVGWAFGRIVAGTASNGTSAAITTGASVESVHDSIAEDSTADKTLAITAQLGSASTSLQVSKLGIHMRLE